MHYEVMFACIKRDGSVVPYLRTIAVPSHLALAVAYAMVGELVGPGQRLDCMVYVIPTNNPPQVPPALKTYRSLWERVLSIVDRDPDQVKWWYSFHIGMPPTAQGPQESTTEYVARFCEPEIVGFR